MNYDFFLDSDNPVLLAEDLKLNETTRPQVGQVICLAGKGSTQYKIVRASPSNNPATEKVQYFVVPNDPEKNPFRMDHDRLEADGLYR